MKDASWLKSPPIGYVGARPGDIEVIDGRTYVAVELQFDDSHECARGLACSAAWKVGWRALRREEKR